MKDVASELLPSTANSTSKIQNSKFSPSLRDGEFWANKDISFELRRGECIGLIGHNGAGKSTLLKMLNGLIKPDSGTIEMRGRVGALIALGAGFNPILTGRENIYVNGSILGLTKREITEKIDDIIEFAEIGEFIDSPVQSYSSGMTVRLGFAVATALDPDILILDEVLAVGDVGFRTKCYNRVYEVCKNAAVIFVSHSMPHINRLCDRVMLLNGGSLEYDGDSAVAINKYYECFPSSYQQAQIASDVSIDECIVNGVRESGKFSLSSDRSLSIRITGFIPNRVKSLEIRASLLEPSMDFTAQSSSRLDYTELKNPDGKFVAQIMIPNINLGSGRKKLSLAINDYETNEILYWAPGLWEIDVDNQIFISSPVYYPAKFSIMHHA